MNKDVCQDIIAYGRERVIGNEIQFLMVTLATTTMYATSPSDFVSMMYRFWDVARSHPLSR